MNFEADGINKNHWADIFKFGMVRFQESFGQFLGQFLRNGSFESFGQFLSKLCQSNAKKLTKRFKRTVPNLKMVLVNSIRLKIHDLNSRGKQVSSYS